MDSDRGGEGEEDPSNEMPNESAQIMKGENKPSYVYSFSKVYELSISYHSIFFWVN